MPGVTQGWVVKAVKILVQSPECLFLPNVKVLLPQNVINLWDLSLWVVVRAGAPMVRICLNFPFVIHRRRWPLSPHQQTKHSRVTEIRSLVYLSRAIKCEPLEGRCNFHAVESQKEFLEGYVDFRVQEWSSKITVITLWVLHSVGGRDHPTKEVLSGYSCP
jgi:hypothetical protein